MTCDLLRINTQTATNTHQITDETFAKMLANRDKITQRLNSLHFDLNDPANAEIFAKYEKKMELTEQMQNKTKEIESAKTLVLTVRVRGIPHF